MLGCNFDTCYQIFHGILIMITIGIMYTCLNEYLANEDVARVDFKHFNAKEGNRYPTVSLCIARVSKIFILYYTCFYI